MVKRQNGIKVKYIVSALLVLLISLITIIFGGGVSGAYAAAVDYSGVMQDLQKDENFNPEDYPQNNKDYSLQVIQIAESTDKKLFLYVYNPCGVTRPLIATCVNMSLTQSVDNTRLYNLTYVSSNGVFGKYLVNGVTVSEETERYYNITSIYRKWDKDIDGELIGGNTSSGKAFPIGRMYCVKNENGKIKYSWDIEKVVEILNPYAGVVRYSNGFKLYEDACDSHYIAFNTDWNIDFLEEAELAFSVTHFFRDYQSLHILNKGTETFNNYVVKYDETGENAADGLWGKKYKWQRIESVESFKNDPQNVFSEDALSYLEGKEWVIRFYETPWTDSSRMHTWYDVHDVTILRLKFKSNGDCYNLGAVSDKVTERPDDPDNINTNEKEGFFEWLADLLGIPVWLVKLIFSLIIIFPILGIALPLLASAVPIVGTVLSVILKALWWIISAPFRFIAWIIRKITGGE